MALDIFGNPKKYGNYQFNRRTKTRTFSNPIDTKQKSNDSYQRELELHAEQARRRKEEQRLREEELERKEEERVRKELAELQYKYEREIQLELQQDEMQLPQLKGNAGMGMGGGNQVHVTAPMRPQVAAPIRPQVPSLKISARGDPSKPIEFRGGWGHKTPPHKRRIKEARARRRKEQENMQPSQPIPQSAQHTKINPLDSGGLKRSSSFRQPLNPFPDSNLALPTTPSSFTKEMEEMRLAFQRETEKLKAQLVQNNNEIERLHEDLKERSRLSEKDIEALREDVDYFEKEMNYWRDEAEAWKLTTEKLRKKYDAQEKKLRSLKSNPTQNTQKTSLTEELQSESILIPINLKIS